MTRVVVTGGTGVLGRELVPRLKSEGYTVRVVSRRSRGPDDWPDVEWVQADLEMGKGLAQAVTEAQIIIHAASDAGTKTQTVDVEGTRRLIEHAKGARVAHFIYISIVGIDRIPFPYYQFKVATEAVVAEGGVPWSTLRATQFHNLIDWRLGQAMRGRLPIVAIPTDYVYQAIDPGEVADKLCGHVAAGPGGLLPDLGGPEVLTYGDMAKAWLQARGWHRLLIRQSVPGPVGEGFRQGYHTCPDHKHGKIIWAEWVKRKYGQPPC